MDQQVKARQVGLGQLLDRVASSARWITAVR